MARSRHGDDVPDVLGPGWTATTLPLRPDGGTPDPVATLVHRVGSPGRRALLYVHGFVDYFFQTARRRRPRRRTATTSYALDLRDFGRSIRAGRRPNYVTDLGAFAEEIDAAVRAILRADHDEVVLLGHSMGGLVTSLWADARPGEGLVDAARAEQPVARPARLAGSSARCSTGVLDVVGRVAPRLVVGKLAPHYGRALHDGTGGEWAYDLAWKPLDGLPGHAPASSRTVRRGHARVARGLAIDVPVLVLASDAIGPDDRRGTTRW